MARIASGIEGLDALVGGGLPEGSSIILQGPSGLEKLQFALTFLAEGLKTGGSGVLVVASQTAESILSELRVRGVDLDAVAKENRLRIVDWYSWSEERITDVEERGIILRSTIDLSSLGAALSRAIAALPNGPGKRAVVEMFSPALNVYELTQVYAFAQSAKRKFDRFAFTSFFLVEKDMHDASVLSTLAQPFDGVIELERTRTGDRIVRKIGVLHLKDTTPPASFVPLEPTEKGFRVVVAQTPPSVPSFTSPETPPPQGVKKIITPPLTEPESAEARTTRVQLINQIAEERLRVDPTDKDAWFALAAGQAILRDVQGSLTSLEKLAALDPRYPGLWVLKAKLHARLGQEEEWRQARMKADEFEEPSSGAAAGLVPCPVCNQPVAPETSLCPHCGSRTEPERDIIEELEALTKATIQDLVEESAHQTVAGSEAPPEAKPKAKPAVKPEEEIDVDKSLDELAALVAEPAPAAPKASAKTRAGEARKGLTNGLVFGRKRAKAATAKGGRTNGLTNGLRGRTNGLTNGLGRTNGLTNGLRGRTNGLTNGLGRTNGLTNGLRGRTNGLTNGLGGRTNGLTNGLRGRTNGLTNGLGRTNGLTNGVGRTNGLTNGLVKVAKQRGFFGHGRSSWQRLGLAATLVVLIILLPIVFFWSGPTVTYPIQVDGQFGDWSSVTKVAALPPQAAPNPDIQITQVALKDNLDFLSFYLQVRGNVLSGGPAPDRVTNSYFAFIDTDRSRATGYQVEGIGADRMIRIDTWGGQVVSTSLMEFDQTRGARDWNGWVSLGSADAAGSGSQLEFQISWADLSQARAPVNVAFASRSWQGESNAADVVVTDAMPFVLVSQDTRAPTVLSTGTPDLSTFTFHGDGGDVSVTALNVTFQGTFQPTSISSVSLVDGSGTTVSTQPIGATVHFSLTGYTVAKDTNRTLTVRPTVQTADATTVGALLQSVNDVVVGSGGVAFTNPIRVAASFSYVGNVPNVPVVDGGFADWPNVTADPVGDVQPIWNTDVDLSGYAFQGRSGGSYFMAQTVGTALNGTMIPAFNPRYTPPANATGNGTVTPGPPPPPENGTDVIRFFLDSDGSALTGYSIGGIGADYLLEIIGKGGLIVSSEASRFTGLNPWTWDWTSLGVAPSAKDVSRIEAAIPGVAVTNASRAYFQTSGWGATHDDSASSAPMRIQTTAFLVSTLAYNPITTLALPGLTSGTGSAAGDLYGFNVTGVGKVNENGAGYDDIAIGAPYANGGKGAVYLFFGRAGWSPANINAASADVVIYGTTAGDHFGWAIAGAGDVDGNGIGDILVGAPDAGAGKAYLIYGRTDWSAANGQSVDAVANVVTIVGQNTGDKFGSAVAGLGNIDNSGNADFAVGAWGYASNKGRAYVFYGNGAIPTNAVLASLFLEGSTGGDKFGFSIAGSGNVNGDSYSDFVVGAPGANKAYVYTLGINPVTNGFLSTGATGWTSGEVDPKGFDTEAWDSSGGTGADLSGGGSYRFNFSDNANTTTLYFHKETVTVNTAVNYELDQATPDGSTANSIAVTAKNAGDHLVVGNWTLPAMGVTQIAAGIWTFNYYGKSTASASHFDVHIFKRASGGTLTCVDGTGCADATDGVGGSATIGNTFGLITGTFSMPTTSVASSDALVVRVYAHATTFGGGSATINFQFDASATVTNSNVVLSAAYPEVRVFHAETANVNGVTDRQLFTNTTDKSSPQLKTVATPTVGRYLIAEWSTPPLGISIIPGGDWLFYLWGNTSAPAAHFDVHILKQSSNGSSACIDGTTCGSTTGVAPTGALGAGTAVGLTVGSVRLNAVNLQLTDSLLVRVYVNATATSANKLATFQFDNSTVYSRFSWPGQTYTDRMWIVSSASFTSPPGTYTNLRFRFSYNSTVSQAGDAYYRVKFQIRDGADTTTVATAYDSGNLTATQSWALQSGVFTGLSASTAYKVRILLEVYNINLGQKPSIRVQVDDIDLQFETVTTLTGTGSFGWSTALIVSAAGIKSLNNDDFADVVVGAPTTSAGTVSVYYGSASFDSTADLTITGGSSGDQFGYSVSSAGDVAGGGVSDLVVGAPYAKNGGKQAAGSVYVFYGYAGLAGSVPASAANQTNGGETSNDHFGWSVSSAYPGGGAISVVLVGAPHYDAGTNTDAGKTYVLAIPEFPDFVAPVLFTVVIGLVASMRRRVRRKQCAEL